MKFVDQATIRVVAGKGGDGCLSFLRERHRPKGGPDGGDGGAGGSIYLAADRRLTTLADFRYVRLYRARGGQGGAGRDCFGRGGADLTLRAPPGTIVSDAHTGERIGEVVREGARLLLARGGKGGLGNARFKSSTNRTPRKTTPGGRGDERRIALELKVLADVGLLGLPNAGKSTLLSRVSRARPKIADYPFTTLHPHLGVVEAGVVDVGGGSGGGSGGFVMADLPGLIEGAAEGTGLGDRFLKHLARNHILLHLVDIAPADGKDPARAIREIERELRAFDPALLQKERWLVLNKTDLIPQPVAETTARDLRRERRELRTLPLDPRPAGGGGEAMPPRPVYLISAASGKGCAELIRDLTERLSRRNRAAQEAAAESPAAAMTMAMAMAEHG